MESLRNYIKRMLRDGLKNQKEEDYLIKITFSRSLNEHRQIQDFKKSTNRFIYHPEQTHPPVKAHYHVIPRNGNNEIYAVNIDGTAHHQKNKGYKIPKKEAKELRKMGVKLNSDNIIEYFEMDMQELLVEENEFSANCLYLLIEYSSDH